MQLASSRKLPSILSAAKREYEQLPYPCAISRDRRVENLSLRARLHGLAPAPPEDCRVLELGCGNAGPLARAAYDHPKSEFVGVDLSTVAIAQGRSLIKRCGLTNATLVNGDVTDQTIDLGSFDYITVFGLYSWLSLEAQDRILALCQDLLTPSGVCVIHYRTYPGSYSFESMRRLCQLHTRKASGRSETLREIGELLHFLNESLAEGHPLWRELGQWSDYQENQQVRSQFYHDYLAEETHPAYFLDLVSRAMRYGLDFVCEMAPSYDWHAPITPRAGQALRRLTDPIEREQYRDFLTNNNTRYSLFCRAGQPIEHDIDESQILGCRVLPRYASSDSLPTVTGDSFGFSPAAQSIVATLDQERQRGIDFTDLVEEIQASNDADARIGSMSCQQAELLSFVRIGYEDGLFELWPGSFKLTERVSERPGVIIVTRAMADEPSYSQLVNQRCDPVQLNDQENAVLAHLDGKHRALDIAREVGMSKADVEAALGSLAEHALLVL